VSRQHEPGQFRSPGAHVAHSPRPTARASWAAARRHLPPIPRSKSLRAARCCAEACRAAITASEGRRNEPGPPFGPRAALVLHGRLSSPGHARCHRPRPAGATAAELPAAARCCSLLRRMTSLSISNWAPVPRRCRPPYGVPRWRTPRRQAPRRRAPRWRMRRTHRPGPRTCPGRLRETRRARVGARLP